VHGWNQLQIRGCRDRGAGWAEISKTPFHYAEVEPHYPTLRHPTYELAINKILYPVEPSRSKRSAKRPQPSFGKAGSTWGVGIFNRLNVRRPNPRSPTRSYGWGLSWTSGTAKGVRQRGGKLVEGFL